MPAPPSYRPGKAERFTDGLAKTKRYWEIVKEQVPIWSQNIAVDALYWMPYYSNFLTIIAMLLKGAE
jgi:hypothetical protein